jgi:preprotein translocase subunit SecG
MMTVVAIVHIIFCLLLISLVLLQDPKSSGGGGGVFGGGGANSLLGATGGATFLTRLTRYSAVVFGITCMTLTLMSRPQTGSVIDTGNVKSTSPIAPFEKPASDPRDNVPKGTTPANSSGKGSATGINSPSATNTNANVPTSAAASAPVTAPAPSEKK